ncbi:unnamed protein product [Symbiodinium natans]|uniref:DUF4042 domain-containing protein n=1 Tax=Symbiodinium natans TaxID=878477 RepID=A0A812LU63_9DINO|nr:unnamed protein product [Symbiodinium natans]
MTEKLAAAAAAFGQGKASEEALWSEARSALRQSPEALEPLLSLRRGKERFTIPTDVAMLCVRQALTLLESPVASMAPHDVLHFLSHAVVDASPTASEAEHLVQVLSTSTSQSRTIQTCSQGLLCLQKIVELHPSALRQQPAKVATAITSALHVLSDTLQQQRNRSARSVLREAASLLTALPALIEQVGRELEPSALVILACLQPVAVVGAPYVLPGRRPAAAAPAGPPGLPSSDCSWSETDAISSAVETKSRGHRHENTDGTTAASSLQAQCRTAALRDFAHLFKLWPKAFFGRWALVLDFQSGEVCRPTGSTPLPMLLSICQQDPAPKVRSAALGALCALLAAPNVRSWPVPLESQKVQSSASLTGQLAITLRQAHAVVFALLGGGQAVDVQNALRACGDLAASTPYTKLQSGLLSEMLRKLMVFAEGLSVLTTLEEAVPPVLSSTIAAVSAVLKRDDCASELSAFLFCGSSPHLPANDFLKHLLHLMQLPGPPLPSQAAAPAAKSGSRKGKGRAAKEEPAAEALEAPILQELALLVSRLASFSPPSLPDSTAKLFEQLVFSLVTQRNAMLRLRGFRFLGELSSIEGGPGHPFSADWCDRLVHHVRLSCTAPAEQNSSVRAAAIGALQTVLRNAAACDGKLRPALLSGAMVSLRLGLGDANASVRTSAVQALAALALNLPQASLETSGDGDEVIQLVLHLTTDVAGDVAGSRLDRARSALRCDRQDMLSLSRAWQIFLSM